jgi:hypothetical protein
LKAACGNTTPTLVSVSEMGMIQNHPRFRQAMMRMSPERRPDGRGTPE